MKVSIYHKGWEEKPKALEDEAVQVLADSLMSLKFAYKDKRAYCHFTVDVHLGEAETKSGIVGSLYELDDAIYIRLEQFLDDDIIIPLADVHHIQVYWV